MTKSLWPWNLFSGFREDAFHDHTDLSQHPANSVPDVGETATDVRGAAGPEKVAETWLLYRKSAVVSPGNRRI